MTSMAAPWGALPAGPAASTTEFETTSMVAPWGCYRQVRQHPPLSF
jgi:hypothetical protein